MLRALSAALSAAALSAAVLLAFSRLAMEVGVSFCGFSSASFPGGWGTAFPGRAVVRRIRPFESLYPSGCTHSPFTKDQPLADWSRASLGTALTASVFVAVEDFCFGSCGALVWAVTVKATVTRERIKERRRVISIIVNNLFVFETPGGRKRRC